MYSGYVVVKYFNSEEISHFFQTISLIFGNIVDIYELTVTLLGNLEDAMEMSQDSHTPYIGSCFEGICY